MSRTFSMSTKTMPVLKTTVLTSNNTEKDNGAADSQEDYLSKLKALAKKLKLDKSRPSYLEWRAQLETQRAKVPENPLAAKDGQIRTWSSLNWPKSALGCAVLQGQRRPPESLKEIESFGKTLEWLKNELREMRVQDQQLAQQLMRLHSDLNKLKIEQTCNQHRKMLNDATFELEEREEMLDLLCDIPASSAFSLSAPLKLIGITKMNINTRRFSLC